MLPFIEQEAMYQQIKDYLFDQYPNNGGFRTMTDPISVPAVHCWLSSLGCPGDSNFRRKFPDTHRYNGNYCISAGDFPATRSGGGGSATWDIPNGTLRGAFKQTSRGVGMPDGCRDIHDFIDGLSNTAMFSERITAGSQADYVRGGLIATACFTGNDGNNALVGVPGNGAGEARKNPRRMTTASDTPLAQLNPQTCLNRVTATNPMQDVSTCWRINDGYAMGRWYAGHGTATWFSTILPPNGPSCLSRLNQEYYGMFSASSYHSGGVNVARCDASVNFINNSINCGNLSSPAAWQEASPYGIWGAFGSLNAGEPAVP
jgi:hypothetical protein